MTRLTTRRWNWPSPLTAQQLRHVLEMPIAGHQREIMLQRERRNPKVVVRNRCPRAFELYKQTRVVLRCFSRRKQNSNRGFGQEALQKNLVAMLLRAPVKS